jgi:DHA1 family multidrug resistance protein B-like MFS transporter
MFQERQTVKVSWKELKNQFESPTMFKSLHLNIKLRLFESFLNALLNCMVFPFMIIYFAEHFGEVASGIISATNVILSFLVGFHGGHFADKYGRRKLLMISNIVQTVVFIGMALANSVVVWPVVTLFCCSINSMIFGFSSPASQAMTLDATTEKERKFVYGIQYWLFNLAFLIGTLLGGALFTNHKHLLMALLIVGTFISFIVLKFFIEELYHQPEEQKNMLANYLSILKDRRFIFFSLGSALITSIEFQLRNYLAVKLAANDELFNYSILISENAGLVVFLGLISSYFISKASHKKTLIIGGLLYIIGMSLLAGFRDIYTLIVLMAIGTIGELVLFPAQNAISTELIPDNNRSSYMAAGNVFGRISMLIGALAVSIGHFLNHWQMAAWFMTIGFAGLTLVLLNYKKNQQ